MSKKTQTAQDCHRQHRFAAHSVIECKHFRFSRVQHILPLKNYAINLLMY